MYIDDKAVQMLATQFQSRLGDSIKNTSEQILGFLEDTDWAMIIKLHAVIEAAITQLILAHTAQEALRSVIERLPLSDNQTGKGKVALDLGLITRSQYSFLRKLSELRNSLVHKVENLDFNLKDYFKGLDLKQRTSWKATISWTARDGNPQTSLGEMIDVQPKTALFMAVFTFVTLTNVDVEHFNIQRDVQAASVKTMTALFSTADETQDFVPKD